MHVIAGLPRSGSTLLCNVLNQNPAFHATSTSPLPRLIASYIQILSTSPEVKGGMALDRTKAEQVIKEELRSVCQARHGKEHAGLVLFNKNRDWPFHLLDLWSFFPDAKAIITVRDLRGIFASIEKRHRETAFLNEAGALPGKTIRLRAKVMTSDEGLIGQPLMGIRDIIDRKLDVGERVKFVKLESFSRAPKSTIAKIYEFLDIPPFKDHQFDNIESTAEDPDWLYNWKFPHDGSGQLMPTNNDEWKSFFTDEIAALITRDSGEGKVGHDFRWFQRRFGVKDKQPEEPSGKLKSMVAQRISTGK